MKREFKGKKCYFCDELATSEEHAPPKCFFPKQKYFPRRRPHYRDNLLVVPSCAEHNESRAIDDEYTALSIVMAAANRNLAFSPFIEKWFKVLKRNNWALAPKFFSRSKLVKVVDGDGSFETLSVTFDKHRIDRVIESTARALYYYELNFQKRWLGDCQIHCPHMLTSDLSKQPNYPSLHEMEQAFAREENGRVQIKGRHPDIFYYQILKDPRDNGYILRMVYYRCFTFFAILEPILPTSG